MVGRLKNELMGEMFKDKKKQGNCRNKSTFIVGSSTHFWSFGVHNNMNVESAIEKL
jgi:hypothetical protein